jgi:hypothetical protein
MKTLYKNSLCINLHFAARKKCRPLVRIFLLNRESSQHFECVTFHTAESARVNKNDAEGLIV